MAIPTDSWIIHDPYPTTITTTIATGTDTVTITDPQLNFNSDKTPQDPFEEAELKLAGVCPACRNEDGEHEWDCKHYNYSTSTVNTIGGGITFNSNYNYQADTEIKLGQATLDEAKIKKLDKLLDLFDDDELEQLILAKQTKKVDKE